VPYAQLLHSEVVAGEETELARQHSFALRGAPDTTFFSATSEAPLTLDPETLPRTLARMAREQLDFPKLVDRVWHAGARVFVELGGGTSCSRLVAANLQGRPHVTIAIDRRNVDVQTSIIRCLARLHSHRVAIDLSRLEAIS
jgi:acyl transferase domain-containing protein